ncbi:uncharacterized protein TRAVEDRAFT_50529 [Trametes versicolor FP-101664 SS1]|uniref:uncharacterized protein n=1 Tax=Trametes versicolor (strain FP-101664) TaxID=717944 RepID=UPI0004621A3E|nr:uncharacterized protein TRAVEDRAFT_50529 [Trametes versicolor FP-101664 SS1]EIW56039.1 hypothetical protein TRAVEDRAFT_50529 [Trametes versicolor FP-101664 SS1]
MDEELHIQICDSISVDSEDDAEVGAGADQDVGDIRPHNRYGPWTKAPGRPRRSRLDCEYAILELCKDSDGPSAENIRTTTKAYADNANALKEDSPRDSIAFPERALEQPSLHSAAGESPPQPRSTTTPRSTPSQPCLDLHLQHRDHQQHVCLAQSGAFPSSSPAPLSRISHPAWNSAAESAVGHPITGVRMIDVEGYYMGPSTHPSLSDLASSDEASSDEASSDEASPTLPRSRHDTPPPSYIATIVMYRPWT